MSWDQALALYLATFVIEAVCRLLRVRGWA